MERQSRSTPCGLCGRDVATRFARQRRLVNRQSIGADKERVAHKCPHGVWCRTGGIPGKPSSRLLMRSHNSDCPECRADRRRRLDAE